MTEPRQYSAAEVASLLKSNLMAWASAATLFCVIPSAALFFAIPKFESMFQGFGADLPARTQLVLESRSALWFLPALTVCLVVLSLTSAPDTSIAWHRRMVWLMAAICCVSLIVQALAIAALYAPIFQLGAVI